MPEDIKPEDYHFSDENLQKFIDEVPGETDRPVGHDHIVDDAIAAAKRLEDSELGEDEDTVVGTKLAPIQKKLANSLIDKYLAQSIEEPFSHQVDGEEISTTIQGVSGETLYTPAILTCSPHPGDDDARSVTFNVIYFSGDHSDQEIQTQTLFRYLLPEGRLSISFAEALASVDPSDESIIEQHNDNILPATAIDIDDFIRALRDFKPAEKSAEA